MILLLLVSFGSSASVLALDFNYKSSNQLNPNDYLMGSYGEHGDPIFDTYKTVDLDIDLGIGSDCGVMNIRNTLKAALKNVLDAKYVGSMGKNIAASSPMLLTCYFSPTWCAILKHSRLQANFVAQTRLDQCKAIDKYVDTRVEDFYQERAGCVRQQIQKTGGNLEQAMERCKNYWNANIANWAGDKFGSKTGENRLIDSTAKWAGFNNSAGKKTVSLVKALVGDTVIKKGEISVDFGPRKIQLTPRTYLMELEKETFSKLCEGIVPKVMNKGASRADLEKVVTASDIQKISGNTSASLIDRQSILSLSLMPARQRRMACRKLSDAISMTIFTSDMSQSLDFISSKMGANPHLPENRKQESERKRQALKDQIEMTLTLHRHKSEPLNDVLYQINSEGKHYLGQEASRSLEISASSYQRSQTEGSLMDCADGVFCP